MTTTLRIDVDTLRCVAECARVKSSVDPDILIVALIDDQGVILQARRTKEGKRLQQTYLFSWHVLADLYTSIVRHVVNSELDKLIASLRSK